MRELRPGLWHWQARHAEWRESEPWDPNVSSYAISDDEHLQLFDPLGVPSEIEALAAERETAIVLTAPWHERDAESLVARLGVPVYTPLPDSAQFLMDTYGLTAEQAGDGSPDVVWLLRENKGEARPYSAGDRLPFGADVFQGHKTNDTVLLGLRPLLALPVEHVLATHGGPTAASGIGGHTHGRDSRPARASPCRSRSRTPVPSPEA